MVKVPKLNKAPVAELLEALKVPEELTRTNAKQVLKERGAKEVIPALRTWVSGLDKKDKDYEHNLLEALWVFQALDTVNEPLLLSLINAESHNARAAGLRALTFWYTKINNVPGILAKAVTDKHAQVRLEAVIALRKTKTPEAAHAALSVLDLQMDEFIDYALWQTVRELEPVWMAKLKTDPNYFGDAKKSVYALKSLSSQEAVAQLISLYGKGQVPQEYQKDVLDAIAKSGQTADLNMLLDLTVQNKDKNVIPQLATLEDAARQRKAKPDKNPERVADFIGNEDETVSLSAIRLAGLWKLETLNDRLTSLIKTGTPATKKAALGALASIDKEKAVKLMTEITGPKNTPEVRIISAAQLAAVNPVEGAKIATELMRTLPADTDVTDLYMAFIPSNQGAAALAEAIAAKKIPVETAKLGRQLVQTRAGWKRQRIDQITALNNALEASGGTLPVQNMKQDLNDKEIASLAKVVTDQADPVKGELIFRRSSTSCTTCHAIGGAGGRIGPDLSSLGTSSPVETIIRSVLYPSVSIKEGYDLKRVVKKDGSELLGYLASDGASEIVIRDVTGKEVSIAKSQVQLMEKVPGSLMPPGLTASLDRKEFIDLIGFLSKMGESGKFRVPTTRFVRRWNTVEASKETAKRILAEGTGYVVKDKSKITFQPVYSKVAGDLPLEDLPVIEGAAGKKYSFIRFEIEVLTKGNVDLAFSSTAGITAWSDGKLLKLAESGAIADFSQGIHTITLAVDRSLFNDNSLNVQLQDAQNGGAQTRLVMGK